MVWMMSKFYDWQFGKVIGRSGRSTKFNITGGLRKGCVLIPRLFSTVLHFAMRKWRLKIGDLGFDFFCRMGCRISSIYALRMSFFFLARSAMEVGKLLDSLVDELPEVKLVLHALI